ncbi:hypothetical protein Daus18300_003737 [Diaporthe australafricana]|uniref:Uncharacterized protein n=1 Tax=Diaporthe australafricana TaxID=127596 RepID=A0ABR3XD28_9PEZI
MQSQDNTLRIEPVKQVPRYETHFRAEKGISSHHSTVIHRTDLTTNLEAKIKNPLAGIPRHELMSQVEDFADQRCLAEYTDLLKKGALIAQDPDNYDNIPEEQRLTIEECTAIQAERQHKWRVPKMLYMTIITCSIGAAVQGRDQEGSNDANLSFPQFLGIDLNTSYGTYIQG